MGQNSLDSSICYSCKKPVNLSSQCVQVSGMTFHQEHFNCTRCSTPLSGSFYNPIEYGVYCDRCYELEMNGTLSRDMLSWLADDSLNIPIVPVLTCGYCNIKISPQSMYIAAAGKFYHPGHFNCARCEKSLAGKFYNPIEDQLFCDRCYRKLKRCVYCGGKISGRILTFRGRSWHHNHYICVVCGVSLIEIPCCMYRGSLYCYDHYIKLSIVPSKIDQANIPTRSLPAFLTHSSPQLLDLISDPLAHLSNPKSDRKTSSTNYSSSSPPSSPTSSPTKQLRRKLSAANKPHSLSLFPARVVNM